MSALKRHIPMLGWLKTYRRADLGGDVTAGLTTAVMLVPQAMAYAMLAGLPPEIGLYASIVPLMVYALFGTSRQLAVGPVAMVSLLVAAGVGAVAEPGSTQYLSYAVLLALMVGAIQLTMGLVKAGFLVNFLSHPVISGFTSAAAIIIGVSQLKHLLGVSVPRSPHFYEVVGDIGAQVPNTNVATLLIGLVAVALLLGFRRWSKRFPAALVVVAAGTLAVVGFGFTGVATVGEVPSGLPALAVPAWDWSAIETLWPIALTIALVSFMESVSVAQVFARKYRYQIEPNQELVGLGLANVAGSMFGAYPVTGGFSRTAVNDQAGARTGIAAIITAVAVAATLLFLTPLFVHMPKAVLAAIIVVAVSGLVDIKEMRHLWQVSKSDLALLAVTFVATLLVGIEEGILIGVGASLLSFVVRTTRPHTAVLGKLPGSNDYRNLVNFDEAEPHPDLLIVRMDAQFYFGNASFLKSELARLEAARTTPLAAVVIDACAMNRLDSSADAVLHELAEAYQERGVGLFFASVKGPVRRVMKRSGFTESLGADHFLLNVHDAVLASLAWADSDTSSNGVADAANTQTPDAPTNSAAAA